MFQPLSQASRHCKMPTKLQMYPTIKDIAAKANISYATVSRALNGKYGVSSQTRVKVLALAEEMGYRPNAIAQGLVKQSTNTIGLVIPDITSPFYPQVALGVDDTMVRAGFNVFLCNSNWDVEREKAVINQLSRKQVDGILLSSLAVHSHEIEHHIPPNIPLVYLSSYPEDTQKSYVRLDNIKGADMAVSHLLSRGRRRIVFIGSRQEQHSLADRLEGYKNALWREGITADDELIRLGKFQEQSGYTLIKEVLASGVEPDGVFAESDLIAMGVIQGLLDSGYRVPEDISVIGFDDIPIASHRGIQLSTIHQPKYRIGRYAAEIILDLFNVSLAERTVQRKTLDPELIIRKST